MGTFQNNSNIQNQKPQPQDIQKNLGCGQLCAKGVCKNVMKERKKERNGLFVQ